MHQLPKAKTKKDVNFLFEQLQIINDETINGKEFWMLLLINNQSIYIKKNIKK